MTPNERTDHLCSVSDTILDYRYGEVAPISPRAVDRWLRQFEAHNQPIILQELDAILRKLYVSKQSAVRFFRDVLNDPSIFGPNPAVGVGQTEFLHLQRSGKGASQCELFDLFAREAKYIHGADIAKKPTNPRAYVYLDDCLYTGNTAKYDLLPWLDTAQGGRSLHIILLGLHEAGWEYFKSALRTKIDPKRIVLCVRSYLRIENRTSQHTKFECLWPLDGHCDQGIEDYVTEIRQRATSKCESSRARTFRPASVPTHETLFSSSANRRAFEHAFLQAGLAIRSRQVSPKPSLRPLGFECLESLGFGSLFVTFRNIANNCPLALWWGVNNWHPLFPRKTNPDSLLDVVDRAEESAISSTDIPF
jgi:hypothetical protein